LLPKIEQLSIHVDEDIHLEYVGKIADIVDCLALQVYDVIGSISDPLYAIRFNTVEEAKEYKKGDSVYFAPKIDQFTHTLFPEQMIKLIFLEKIGDDFWDGEGECPVNEMVFSDDESERNFLEGSKKPKENRGSYCSIFYYCSYRL
uniref:H/ACA ribonucleoprotein complex subunit n=1 Tax=Dracunculus medinensis TaxID=318479 RepID=A0A0N4UD21_DRAME